MHHSREALPGRYLSLVPLDGLLGTSYRIAALEGLAAPVDKIRIGATSSVPSGKTEHKTVSGEPFLFHRDAVAGC
jgi:hypothetical protein